MMLEAIILVSLVLAAYPYVGYPIVLHVLTRRRGDPRPPTHPDLPSVTLVIAAYNEDGVIEEKIKNVRELSYPRDRLRVLIGSDGSADKTVMLARSAAADAPYINILEFAERRGKPAVLHDLINRAESDVVATSDANTLFASNALERLARWFADRRVGGVCGRLQLVHKTPTGRSEQFYWTFETWLKRRENRLGVVLGANGGIYAFRRAAYVPISADTITDDFVLPMLIRERGHRIVFDDSALAIEETAPTIGGEFGRRIRIGAGNLQALWKTRRLLKPVAGWIAFAYWSHKVLRWATPLFLALALMISFFRVHNALSGTLVLVGTLALALAAVGWILERYGLPIPGIIAAFYSFVAMNVALMIGAIKLARGTQSVRWSRTPRSAEISKRSQRHSEA